MRVQVLEIAPFREANDSRGGAVASSFHLLTEAYVTILKYRGHSSGSLPNAAHATNSIFCDLPTVGLKNDGNKPRLEKS